MAKINAELLKALSLADDATDDQVDEALKAAGLALLVPGSGAPPAAPPAAPAAPPTAPPAAPPAGVPGPAPQLVAASALPEGFVAVDNVSLSELTTRLAASETRLKDIQDKEDKARRDEIVNLAAREGKISPLMVSHYRQMLDVPGAEVSTAALLAASPVLFSTRELGHGEQTLTGAVDNDAVMGSIRSSFFPKGL